jgi:hypothetical protein
MLRRLSIGLLASAVAIAPLPLKAEEGSAEDLGDVMSIHNLFQIADVDSGVIRWVNAHLVTHIVPRV